MHAILPPSGVAPNQQSLAGRPIGEPERACRDFSPWPATRAGGAVLHRFEAALTSAYFGQAVESDMGSDRSWGVSVRERGAGRKAERPMELAARSILNQIFSAETDRPRPIVGRDRPEWEQASRCRA